MLSFVWLSRAPFRAGTGGSENYTAGHIRELKRRGIQSRIITVGLGEKDGRDEFPDIDFYSVDSQDELSELDDTLVFVTHPISVPTKRPSYVILHCPLSRCDQTAPFSSKSAKDKQLIAPSKFSAQIWTDFFKRKIGEVPVVYPFAEKCFSAVTRPVKQTKKIRVLFAGRLTPDKGIYTLLAALHFKIIDHNKFTFTATTAGSQSEEGQIVHQLLDVHPHLQLIPARKDPASTAALFADHDIVVMPSTNQFWQETFGMVSVEAQHAGCRVVASRAGGLPETDCGGLILVEPDNPYALAEGILQAASAGSVTAAARRLFAQRFHVEESVDSLLKVVKVAPSKLIGRVA